LDSGFAGYTPLPKVPQDLDSGFISHAPVPKLPPDLQRFLTGYDPAPVHGDVQGHFVEAQPTRELDENSSLPFPHGTSLGGELKELHDELDKFQSYPSLRFDPQPWKWENWEPAAQRGAMKIGLKLGMPREWSKYGNLCTDDEKMAVDTQRKALYAMLADMRKKWGKAAREEKRVGKGNERKDKILEAKAIIAELDKTGRSRRDLSKLSSDQKKILFWYEKCKKLDDDFDKGV
jgi:hypothetical protein